MRNARIVIIGILLTLAACTGGEAEPTEDTASLDATTTAAAEHVQETLDALKAEETQAVHATETQAAVAAATATRAAVVSSFVRERAEAATQAVERVLPVIEDLFASGVIDTTAGEYIDLEDYEQVFTERDYFRRYETGQAPFEFVFHSMVTIESEEDNDTTVAGCGISFRKDNGTTGDYILMDFRGRLRYGVIRPDYWSPAGSVPGVLENPTESFELLIVMYGREYRIIVNGEEVLKRQSVWDPGEFWYLIAAGSEAMHCHYVDSWIWELAEE